MRFPPTVTSRVDYLDALRTGGTDRLVEGPRVLSLDLLLLGVVIDDVEVLADLWDGLALHLISHRLARQVQQARDVEVVCGLHASLGFPSVSKIDLKI